MGNPVFNKVGVWRNVQQVEQEDSKRVKTTHKLFMKLRRWRVKENIERRLGENVVLRTRQVDGGVRPYQSEGLGQVSWKYRSEGKV